MLHLCRGADGIVDTVHAYCLDILGSRHSPARLLRPFPVHPAAKMGPSRISAAKCGTANVRSNAGLKITSLISASSTCQVIFSNTEQPQCFFTRGQATVFLHL